MKTQSIDTDPVIERMQIEAMRQLQPGQRFQIACSLTRSAFALSWRNFQSLHKDLDQTSLRILWVRNLYGDDLANRLFTYLERRRTS